MFLLYFTYRYQRITYDVKRRRNTVLNAEQVQTIFVDCLIRQGEDSTHRVEVEGIGLRAWFNPDRLNSHKDEIERMLDELPDEFKASSGGGWSFLNACNDKHGNQWTGLHQRMDQLLMLGTGIGKVECQLPREMWSVVPGGMPYYIIN